MKGVAAGEPGEAHVPGLLDDAVLAGRQAGIDPMDELDLTGEEVEGQVHRDLGPGILRIVGPCPTGEPVQHVAPAELQLNGLELWFVCYLMQPS